jgi:hypothetical protein
MPRCECDAAPETWAPVQRPYLIESCDLPTLVADVAVEPRPTKRPWRGRVSIGQLPDEPRVVRALARPSPSP